MSALQLQRLPVGARTRCVFFVAAVARTQPIKGLATLAYRAAPRLTCSPDHLTRCQQRLNVTKASAITLTEAMPADKSGLDPATKLAKLRELMAAADGGVDALIVPSEDPHMSEYPPDCHARREFISNFTGSAGTVVVTRDAALLWTDGRYFLQAEKQLSPDWTLMRMGTDGCPDIPEWLATNVPTGGRVGIDPFLLTVDGARKLEKQLASAGRTLLPLSGENLVDRVWGGARPAEPKAPLRVHAEQWAGRSVAAKLADIRGQVSTAGAGAVVATMLDEVAWLLNLRGSDVPFNPVFVAYVLVTEDNATLYTNPDKVTPEVEEHLTTAGVSVKPYSDVLGDVAALAKRGTKILIDPSKVSLALYDAASDAADAGAAAKEAGPRGKRRRTDKANGTDDGAAQVDGQQAALVEKASPVYDAKAIKNEQELAGMKEAHLRDGVALCKFFCWLEKTIASGTTITEVEVDDKLTGLRAQQQGFVEPSFATIAGANANGAIIHYRADSSTCATVDRSTLLLVDSGGQYDCGTTDITRTMHFGTPSDHQRACYTRVLQGHIALDAAVFPEQTPGIALDAFARRPLWGMGLNYRHGTGHGVGAALNVHEGPQSISTRWHITTPLQRGMIVSNEPGYYEDGAFGIRIENLVFVKEANTAFRYGGQSFFCFERLTMCPMSTKLMDTSLMSQGEVDWVNTYHKEVLTALEPRLADDEETLEWLRAATAPLAAQ